MIVDRYLAIIDTCSSGEATAVEPIAEGVRRLGLTPSFASEQLAVYVGSSTNVVRLSAGGLVIGSLFSRAENEPPHTLPESISAFNGRALIEDHWGDYVALFVDHPGAVVRALRSPSGGLAAYRAQLGTLTYVTSDVEILIGLGIVRPAVDWTFVAHFVAFPHLRGAMTGVAGVDEVLPGDCTIFRSRTTERRNCWSPWRHAAAECRIDDIDEASAQLRAEVTGCTRALARRYRSVLLELSGGLDSSIVAASLSDSGAAVTCINLVTPTAEGDERRYARQVAALFGFGLEEAFPSTDLDITAAAHRRLPRPGLPGVLRGWEGRFIDAAMRSGAEAYFGGTGGDNVFCSLGSAAPAADVLRTNGLGQRFLRTAREVATVHGSTLWTTARMAWRQARRPPPSPSWPRVVEFLNDDALPCDPQVHPWLDEPSNALGGSRSHIRSIMAAQAHLDGYVRHAVAPSVFPLLAQPVMETCLRIPSWMWVQGGRDRAVARLAFRDTLPATIVGRRTKGMMNAYCTRIYEQNRSALRSLLLEGYLAAKGLIDHDSLGAYLEQPGPTRDIRFYRVLALADVEVWLRSWLGDG